VTVKLPDRSLRAVLALTLGLAGLKLLDVPGANAIIIAAAVAALLVAAFALVRYLLRRPELAPERVSSRSAR
jgi:hypothetical protein